MNNIENKIILCTQSILSSFWDKGVYKDYWDKVYVLDYNNHRVNNESIFKSLRRLDSKK